MNVYGRMKERENKDVRKRQNWSKQKRKGGRKKKT
jgi:hypothetical protein